MEKNDIPSREKKRISIKIEYKDIPPAERVFDIDVNKIEDAIGLMFGNRRKNLMIEINPGLSNESGHYQGGKIVLWQDELVQVARHWYGLAKVNMGEEPDFSYFIPESSKSASAMIKNTLDFLPHKLAGLETPSLLTFDDQQNSASITSMVRASGDMKKGHEMTGKLISDAFKRSMAETFAHEAGHALNRTRIMISGIGIYLTGAALGILTANGFYQNDAPAGVVLAISTVAPILSIGGMMFGIPIIDEKLADEAQKKFFSSFIDAITINSEVFEKKVMASTSNV